MGRYAFFNTGLEYKFVFAVQNSEDIQRFGGWYNNSATEPIIKWSAEEDAEIALARIRRYERYLGAPTCDFTVYSADLEGTQDLHDWLRAARREDNAEFCAYMLGCLIYHQLLYEPALRASFAF